MVNLDPAHQHQVSEQFPYPNHVGLRERAADCPIQGDLLLYLQWLAVAPIKFPSQVSITLLQGFPAIWRCCRKLELSLDSNFRLASLLN
jgi:hypothetical protein